MTSPIEKNALAFTFFNEINIIAQLSSNQFEQVLPHGLTQSQFTVLNWFTRVDTEATPGRLARALMVTRGAMTNTLQKLADKGFLLIEPDSSNGRQKRVTMTEAGAAARQDALLAASGILQAFTGQFKTEEYAAMIPALQAVRQYLDEQRYPD